MQETDGAFLSRIWFLARTWDAGQPGPHCSGWFVLGGRPPRLLERCLAMLNDRHLTYPIRRCGGN